MSSKITSINNRLAIISGNGDLPLNILECAVSKGWNGVVIDIADNQKLKSQLMEELHIDGTNGKLSCLQE